MSNGAITSYTKGAVLRSVGWHPTRTLKGLSVVHEPKYIVGALGAMSLAWLARKAWHGLRGVRAHRWLSQNDQHYQYLMQRELEERAAGPAGDPDYIVYQMTCALFEHMRLEGTMTEDEYRQGMALADKRHNLRR